MRRAGLRASSIFTVGFTTSHPELDPPIWSLEIEIQFYCITPGILILYTFFTRLRNRCVLGLGFVALTLATSSLIDVAAPFDGRFRFGLLAHIHLFVAGIVAADIERDHPSLQRPSSMTADVLFAAGSAALVVIGLALARVDARPGGGWPDLLVNLGTLTAIVAILIGALRGRIGRAVLSQPWITLIGTMCFSIYLVHVVVIEALSAALLQRLPMQNSAAILAVYLLMLVPASIGIGALFYAVVERPFMTSVPFHALPFLGRWVARAKAETTTKIQLDTVAGRSSSCRSP